MHKGVPPLPTLKKEVFWFYLEMLSQITILVLYSQVSIAVCSNLNAKITNIPLDIFMHKLNCRDFWCK